MREHTVTDVTSDVEKALARANYEAIRKSVVQYEEQKALLKAELDVHNAHRLDALARAREIQSQIDGIDAHIAELTEQG